VSNGGVSRIKLAGLATTARLSRNGDEFEVICGKGVAPHILDVESTRRFSGAPVQDLQALLSAREEIIFSPLAQGDDYGEQVAALLSLIVGLKRFLNPTSRPIPR
jgi:hypothetical protein